MLCQNSDIFGKSGEGLHSYRLGPFAAVDLILTVIVAILISFIVDSSILKIFIILWIIAEILHKIFCIKTTFWRIVDNI